MFVVFNKTLSKCFKFVNITRIYSGLLKNILFKQNMGQVDPINVQQG